MRWWRSRHWAAAISRMVLLVVVGWLGLSALGITQGQLLPSQSGWKTDFNKALVALREIQSGGPPKDGIPAIDEPRFVSPDAAAAWIDAREPVIVVQSGADARAYPLQILIYHEIVNDRVGGVPMAVTFCPLCNASIVFERTLGGRVYDFGTTGMLRKSDLVMYDRQTESWWQQFTGRAIVGELAGTRLKPVPSSIVAFADFRQAHPQGRVLSRDTGYARPYGNNPYRGYDAIDNIPFLLDQPADARLPAMERVLSVADGDRYRLYPFALFRQTPVINDQVASGPIVVMAQPGTLSVLDQGEIAASRAIYSAAAFSRRLGDRILDFEQRDGRVVDRVTGSVWNLLGQAVSGPLAGERLRIVDRGSHFAFAWLAFRPDSVIFSN